VLQKKESDYAAKAVSRSNPIAPGLYITAHKWSP